MERKDIMALRDLALSDSHCEFGSRDILNLVEAFVQQEAISSLSHAEGFRLCQEMAAAAIIDASDMNGQIYVMRAAAKVRALKVEGEIA